MSNRMHNVYDERARRPHEAPVLARVRRSAGVHRPWHRGRDASENPGGPIVSWPEGRPSTRYTTIEARKGKPS